MNIVKKKLTNVITKDNGRSSDAISPSFIYGCLGGCYKSYCYVNRYNPSTVYIYENLEEIMTSIILWGKKQPWPKKPNQVHRDYYLIDIGCNCDVPLMWKYQPWGKIIDYLTSHEKLGVTFATKYPSRLTHRPRGNKLPRVRISLMPQKVSSILEPNTESIRSRIDQFERLYNLGWEVHVNFSPVIFYDGWLEDYVNLFDTMDLIPKYVQRQIKAEVIFLTYSDLQLSLATNEQLKLLFNPDIQEFKRQNILRYKKDLKKSMIEKFKSIFPEYEIRYIF